MHGDNHASGAVGSPEVMAAADTRMTTKPALPRADNTSPPVTRGNRLTGALRRRRW